MRDIAIFDSTLRDGAQAESISFSVKDKLEVVETLDEIGVKYIEAGNPGSNPKDLEFFEAAKTIRLKNAKLAAFGSTRRRDIAVEDDSNVLSLLKAETPAVVIFGKSWDFHVTDIIRTTFEENLKMIEETLAFFVAQGKEVIYDAEHFFDGYKNNAGYAMQTLEAAVKGGATTLCLCDTNGGTLSDEVSTITAKVVETYPELSIGIHAHDDSGMAVANSVMAILAGASHVQGTFIGFGERCGNANLSAIIPNLQLKRQLHCLPEESIKNLTQTARRIGNIANINIPDFLPFVGNRAFAHKGGMHIDGINKNSKSFEHIDPDTVGNERRFLISEVAGRSVILEKIQAVDPSIDKNSPVTKEIVDRLKNMEHDGYQFEGADASFELEIRRHLKTYKPFFELDHYRTIDEQPSLDKDLCSSALIKIKVGNEYEITAAEGDGPVNALDKALRKALEVFYPSLKDVRLTDFKVRVLDGNDGTASKVRVIIESTDGKNIWTTIGVSTDLLEASWKAILDSIEYKLLRD